MTPQQMRHSILEALRELISEAPIFEARILYNRTLHTAHKARYHSRTMRPDPQYWEAHEPEKLLLDEQVWELMRQGVLSPVAKYTPREQGQETKWVVTHLRVTAHGAKVLASAGPVPYDPDGYLQYLDSSVPELDAIVCEYIEEALETFRQGCLRATVVMVGGAAERLADMLQAALLDGTYPTEPAGLGELRKMVLKNPRADLKGRFEAMQKALNELKQCGRLKQYPEAKESIDSIDPVLTAIRQARNDSGHPKEIVVSRSTATMGLQLFPALCKNVYAIIRALETEFAPIAGDDNA